jgi:hypothetical protein
MSLHPEPIEPVPEETARVARAAFPRGNPCLQLRDVLGNIYVDEDFADLFPRRGQSAEAPWRLAEWFDRYARRIEDARLPTKPEERQHYAEVIGADGMYLLEAVYAADAPGVLRELEAVQILRRVWVHRYETVEDPLHWRDRSRPRTDVKAAAWLPQSAYVTQPC